MIRIMMLAGLIAVADAAHACAPDGWNRAQLDALKAAQFEVDTEAQRNALALGLIDCLGVRDSSLRDGIAYEGLSIWMRAGVLSPSVLASLRDRLLPMLARKDRDGFQAPFAALVLSEVARTDRITPWMTPAARAELAHAASHYLASVRDYRGFSKDEGWRHGVAHGADLALQLGLNAKLDKPALDQLLDAIFAQVAPPGATFYHYGEPARLARPLLYIAARGMHDDAEWRQRLSAFADPASVIATVTTDELLARRHNITAFLLAAHFETSRSSDAHLQRLTPLLLASLAAIQ